MCLWIDVYLLGCPLAGERIEERAHISVLFAYQAMQCSAFTQFPKKQDNVSVGHGLSRPLSGKQLIKKSHLHHEARSQLGSRQEM